MQEKQNNKMRVNWTISRPPCTPEKWFKWQQEFSRTEEILSFAFARQLSRTVGWDLEEISCEKRESYREAAAMYKRGIAVLGEDVREESGSYPVAFCSSVHECFALLPAGFDEGPLVIDSKVAEVMFSGEFPRALVMQAGEDHKSIATVGAIRSYLGQFAQDKPLVIMGGGIVADCASFAAHLEQRRFIFVPTTLLAMVDACVGGKTGVNFPPFGKNLVGAFAFPHQVMVCSEFLRTLSSRELRGGGAECLKHGFLAHDMHLVTRVADGVRAGDWRRFAALLPRLVHIKAQVVERDPGETGVRAVLNLGHTLAHALEAISQETRADNCCISHGEAVGVGLLYALQLSRRHGNLSQERLAGYVDALRRSGCLLPRKELEVYLGYELEDSALWDKVRTYSRQDKKNLSDKVRWVVLDESAEFGARCVELAEDDFSSFVEVYDKA